MITPRPPRRWVPLFFWGGVGEERVQNQNHLEERLLDQAQARASYTPPFWGSFA